MFISDFIESIYNTEPVGEIILKDVAEVKVKIFQSSKLILAVIF